MQESFMAVVKKPGFIVMDFFETGNDIETKIEGDQCGHDCDLSDGCKLKQQ